MSETPVLPADDADDKPMIDTRFYGRRKGKALKAGQKALMETLYPRLRLPLAGEAEIPADLKSLFPRPVREVWLEIGFGGGEHLAHQADTHPEIGLIGAEPFVNGIGKLLKHIDAKAVDNIRIYGEDIRPWLKELPDACLDKVFLLFPDPWPKTRHADRRFVNPWNLDVLARVMKDNALFRVASDDMTYIRHTLSVAPVHPEFEWLVSGPEDWRVRWPDAIESRYEAKAHREGRTPKYLTFRRRPRG